MPVPPDAFPCCPPVPCILDTIPCKSLLVLSLLPWAPWCTRSAVLLVPDWCTLDAVMVEDADVDVVLLISKLTTSKQPSTSQSESRHVLNDFMNKAFFLMSFLREFVGRFKSMGFGRGEMPSPSIDRNFAKAGIMSLGGTSPPLLAACLKPMIFTPSPCRSSAHLRYLPRLRPQTSRVQYYPYID